MHDVAVDVVRLRKPRDQFDGIRFHLVRTCLEEGIVVFRIAIVRMGVMGATFDLGVELKCELELDGRSKLRWVMKHLQLARIRFLPSSAGLGVGHPLRHAGTHRHHWDKGST